MFQQRCSSASAFFTMFPAMFQQFSHCVLPFSTLFTGFAVFLSHITTVMVASFLGRKLWLPASVVGKRRGVLKRFPRAPGDPSRGEIDAEKIGAGPGGA